MCSEVSIVFIRRNLNYSIVNIRHVKYTLRLPVRSVLKYGEVQAGNTDIRGFVLKHTKENELSRVYNISV